MKILIAGQARTGTSALFFHLQRTQPADTLTLFEPPTLVGTGWDTAAHSIVKVLVASLPGDDRCTAFDPTLFDRRYVLTRDPRDRLISLLLFLPVWSNAQYPSLAQHNPHGLALYVARLHQKVRAPSLWPVAFLFDHLMRLRFGFRQGEGLPTLGHLQQTFLAWEGTVPHHQTIPSEILRLLCGTAARSPRPPRAYARVYRGGQPGEWRQWFTPEDVATFRPLMQPYLTWYGYGDDWTLPETPQIDPTTSLHYLDKWLRVERRAARALSA